MLAAKSEFMEMCAVFAIKKGLSWDITNRVSYNHSGTMIKSLIIHFVCLLFLCSGNVTSFLESITREFHRSSEVIDLTRYRCKYKESRK